MSMRPVGYPPNTDVRAGLALPHASAPRPIGYPPNLPHAAGPPGPPIQPPHAADPPPPAPVIVAVEQGKIIRGY